MANPNIISISSMEGKTSLAELTTLTSTLFTVPTAGNVVYKVNTILASNKHNTNAVEVTVKLVRNSTDYEVFNKINVPNKSTMVLNSRDSSFYMEQGDTLSAFASASGDANIFVSYEIIEQS